VNDLDWEIVAHVKGRTPDLVAPVEGVEGPFERGNVEESAAMDSDELVVGGLGSHELGVGPDLLLIEGLGGNGTAGPRRDLIDGFGLAGEIPGEEGALRLGES